MAWQPSYAGLANIKAALDIPDNYDDAKITAADAAASRITDTYCRRQFGNAVQVRTYYGRFDYDRCLWVVDTDDFVSLFSVTVDGTATTNYTPEPLNAPADGQPYTRLSLLSAGSVAVSGIFGWPTVPDAVVTATTIQAVRILHRPQSPFGIAGSPDMGNELRLLAKEDPDFQVLLSGYRRTAGIF